MNGAASAEGPLTEAGGVKSLAAAFSRVPDAEAGCDFAGRLGHSSSAHVRPYTLFRVWRHDDTHAALEKTLNRQSNAFSDIHLSVQNHE